MICSSSIEFVEEFTVVLLLLSAAAPSATLLEKARESAGAAAAVRPEAAVKVYPIERREFLEEFRTMGSNISLV